MGIRASQDRPQPAGPASPAHRLAKRKVVIMPPKTSATYLSSTETLTLEPLRTDGSDALPPDSQIGITSISLREIEISWNNARSAVLIRKADDVFACAAEHGAHENPIPKGAHISQAKLAFLFPDSPKPDIVLLRPPATLGLPDASHAQKIKAWLSKTSFLITAKRNACNLLLVCALALGISVLEPDDQDDDPNADPANNTRLP